MFYRYAPDQSPLTRVHRSRRTDTQSPARLCGSGRAVRVAAYVHARRYWRADPWGAAVSGGSDRWIRWTTTGCVVLLALIAGTVSYLHMHTLVELHGQPGWVAALTPFSVDGMIVAASTTLLADSRSGNRGRLLPWALLVAGSVASVAANVAVTEPTSTGRVIAAWPSFALIAAYELLMRQVRRGDEISGRVQQKKPGPWALGPERRGRDAPRPRCRSSGPGPHSQVPGGQDGSRDLRRHGWQWRWPTGPVMARYRPGVRSPGNMVGTSGGVAW